ncbi:MAG: ATP-binding cassette domain-containing protein [Oscillospiraceae bacterium]|nr:ATP-binding cassette domain-containing protein [Oscillospiraceae bacterium]
MSLFCKSTAVHCLKTQLDQFQGEIDKISAVIDELNKQLDGIREKYAGDEEFSKYEAMRDYGIDLARLKYTEMRFLRKDLQIIFQDPYSSLNPRLTVGQIIEEGLVTHKFFKHGSQKMRDYIVETMEKCGLQEYMLHRYPHQFSGGQRQRIAIARALAVKPKFVVCDECVSALDVSIQSQIINLLQELKEKEHLTYMFISHDLSVVRYISDRICVMYLGNVVELADAATVFDDPRHPYTVALLSSIPTTDIDSLSKERIILEGNIPSPIKPPSGCKFRTRCYMACEKCERVPPELREIEPGHFVACHFPEKKMDADGNYLFELPKMERKSMRKEESEN